MCKSNKDEIQNYEGNLVLWFSTKLGKVEGE